MKKRNILIIICSFLVVISAFLVYLNFRKDEKMVYSDKEKEWIDKSIIMIDEILPVFYEMTSIDSLLNDYNFNYPIFVLRGYKSELGLGYTIISLERREALTEVYVSILSDKDNNIINYNINIKGRRNYIMKILDKKFKLSKIKGAKFTYYTNETILRIKHRNKKLYEIYIDDYYNYFQISKDIIIPKEIKSDYETLMKGGIYGHEIGFGNVTLKERKAINKIMELNDKNILLAIIASPYPEGRIYAIEGLFKDRIDDIMNENEYTDILNKIAALNCEVTVGRGCVISTQEINSLESIKNLIYDINNSYNYD
jgi:hypothetical protein